MDSQLKNKKPSLGKVSQKRINVDDIWWSDYIFKFQRKQLKFKCHIPKIYRPLWTSNNNQLDAIRFNHTYNYLKPQVKFKIPLHLDHSCFLTLQKSSIQTFNDHKPSFKYLCASMQRACLRIRHTFKKIKFVLLNTCWQCPGGFEFEANPIPVGRFVHFLTDDEPRQE